MGSSHTHVFFGLHYEPAVSVHNREHPNKEGWNLRRSEWHAYEGPLPAVTVRLEITHEQSEYVKGTSPTPAWETPVSLPDDAELNNMKATMLIEQASFIVDRERTDPQRVKWLGEALRRFEMAAETANDSKIIDDAIERMKPTLTELAKAGGFWSSTSLMRYLDAIGLYPSEALVAETQHQIGMAIQVFSKKNHPTWDAEAEKLATQRKGRHTREDILAKYQRYLKI